MVTIQDIFCVSHLSSHFICGISTGIDGGGSTTISGIWTGLD